MLLALFRCGKSLKYPFGRRLGGFLFLSGGPGKYLPLTGLTLGLSTSSLATITNELQGIIDPQQHLQMTKS
jgi:hypothetical protein